MVNSTDSGVRLTEFKPQLFLWVHCVTLNQSVTPANLRVVIHKLGFTLFFMLAVFYLPLPIYSPAFFSTCPGPPSLSGSQLCPRNGQMGGKWNLGIYFPRFHTARLLRVGCDPLPKKKTTATFQAVFSFQLSPKVPETTTSSFLVRPGMVTAPHVTSPNVLKHPLFLSLKSPCLILY